MMTTRRQLDLQSPRPSAAERPPRRGMTLVELLVTIGIVLSVAAVALPLLAPQGDARRQREAARALSAFFNGARTRAIEIGRPAGVWIEGLPGNPEMIASLSTCEVPPPWAGETTQSVCRVAYDTNGPAIVEIGFVNIADGMWYQEQAPRRMIRLGDTVQLGHHSTRYRIIAGTLDTSSPELSQQNILLPPDGTNVWRLGYDAEQPPPPSGQQPFLIHRAPQKSAQAPLELPAGSLISLDFSGDEHLPLHPLDDGDDRSFWVSTGGPSNHEPHEWVEGRTEPIVVLFSPTGTVDGIYRFRPWNDDPPAGLTIKPAEADRVVWLPDTLVGPLYLLVGKAENLVEGSGELDHLADVLDPDNQWITLDPTTGITRTSEVNAPPPPREDVMASASIPADLPKLTPLERFIVMERTADPDLEIWYKRLLADSRRFLVEGLGRGGQ